MKLKTKNMTKVKPGDIDLLSNSTWLAISRNHQQHIIWLWMVKSSIMSNVMIFKRREDSWDTINTFVIP